MSKRPISDAEAKRLVNKLNRRVGAISLLTSGHFSWRPWLVVGVEIAITPVMVVWLYFSERREDWLLFIVVLALLTLMELYNVALNRRIDAIVELLQQGGLLESKIPPGKVDEA